MISAYINIHVIVPGKAVPRNCFRVAITHLIFHQPSLRSSFSSSHRNSQDVRAGSTRSPQISPIPLPQPNLLRSPVRSNPTSLPPILVVPTPWPSPVRAPRTSRTPRTSNETHDPDSSPDPRRPHPKRDLPHPHILSHLQDTLQIQHPGRGAPESRAQDGCITLLTAVDEDEGG